MIDDFHQKASLLLPRELFKDAEQHRTVVEHVARALRTQHHEEMAAIDRELKIIKSLVESWECPYRTRH